ncbi:hypothetical protein T265_08184 [Opisthorchis viverrini]|uniref:Uncharacterized protein n=1 Tax=Opisthorchis viverrini TaxID=6198 RepID=A0A074ZA13_OPIVI|nr:hypothetical protein T265_08184 [Opisthorchis viverrini]KER24096.1 hypothetical protein T265_08184 [Opisthorchis viverrini]
MVVRQRSIGVEHRCHAVDDDDAFCGDTAVMKMMPVIMSEALVSYNDVVTYDNYADDANVSTRFPDPEIRRSKQIGSSSLYRSVPYHNGGYCEHVHKKPRRTGTTVGDTVQANSSKH